MNKAFSFLIVCMLVILFSFKQPVSPHSARPNILFVIADDWSYPHAGAYGDKVIRTPNKDSVCNRLSLFITKI